MIPTTQRDPTIKKRSVRKTKPTFKVSRKTLDTQHAENMMAHNARREKMAALNAELQTLQTLDAKLDSIDRISEIKNTLKVLSSEGDSVQYFTDTVSVLFRYYGLIESGEAPKVLLPSEVQKEKKVQEKRTGNSILSYFGVPDSSTTKSKVSKRDSKDDSGRQRGSLLDKYMEMVEKDHVKQELLEEKQALCSHCGSEDRTLMNNDGFVICNGCHTVEYTIVDHEKPSYKEPPKEISYYAYKRHAHCREWLSQVQGKETTDIPEEVFDRILLEIKKQRIDNMSPT